MTYKLAPFSGDPYDNGYNNALGDVIEEVEALMLVDHGDIKVTERRIPIHLVIECIQKLEIL